MSYRNQHEPLDLHVSGPNELGFIVMNDKGMILEARIFTWIDCSWNYCWFFVDRVEVNWVRMKKWPNYSCRLLKPSTNSRTVVNIYPIGLSKYSMMHTSMLWLPRPPPELLLWRLEFMILWIPEFIAKFSYWTILTSQRLKAPKPMILFETGIIRMFLIS